MPIHVFLEIFKYLTLLDWINTTSTCKKIFQKRAEPYIWVMFSKKLSWYNDSMMYSEFYEDGGILSKLTPHDFMFYEAVFCYCEGVIRNDILDDILDEYFYVKIKKILEEMSTYEKFKTVYYRKKKGLFYAIDNMCWSQKNKFGLITHSTGCNCFKCILQYFSGVFPFTLINDNVRKEICDKFSIDDETCDKYILDLFLCKDDTYLVTLPDIRKVNYVFSVDTHSIRITCMTHKELEEEYDALFER